MTVLRMKDVKNLGEKDLKEKLKELKMQLIKVGKDKKIKTKEIKKAIARILTTKK